jgi:hypothetical protein
LEILEVVVMAEAKTILCPLCRRKVGTHDGKSTMIKTILCKKDKLLVVYDPLKDKATISRKVERASSSGKRFY